MLRKNIIGNRIEDAEQSNFLFSFGSSQVHFSIFASDHFPNIQIYGFVSFCCCSLEADELRCVVKDVWQHVDHGDG